MCSDIFFHSDPSSVIDRMVLNFSNILFELEVIKYFCNGQ